VIARELHKMLRFSNIRRRYFPPKKKTVWLQSIAVFTWSTFLALWPFLHRWLPIKNAARLGLVCSPVEYSRASTIFFYVVFMPCFVMIPLTSVIYIAIDVIRKGLIPRTGKTRDVAIYFFRLIFVFSLMWLPSLILIFVAAPWLNPWVSRR
jgi:hypothetical protein